MLNLHEISLINEYSSIFLRILEKCTRENGRNMYLDHVIKLLNNDWIKSANDQQQ